MCAARAGSTIPCATRATRSVSCCAAPRTRSRRRSSLRWRSARRRRSSAASTRCAPRRSRIRMRSNSCDSSSNRPRSTAGGSPPWFTARSRSRRAILAVGAIRVSTAPVSVGGEPKISRSGAPRPGSFVCSECGRRGRAIEPRRYLGAPAVAVVTPVSRTRDSAAMPRQWGARSRSTASRTPWSACCPLMCCSWPVFRCRLDRAPARDAEAAGAFGIFVTRGSRRA